MGAEKPMMERLLKVFVALEEKDQQALAKLRASAKTTPERLNPKFTPNQKLLQAAVAYVNARVLAAPGTDPQQAAKLARRVFQVQTTAGHGVVPRDLGDHAGTVGAVETLTPSHAQLWHAGSAALLAGALLAGDNITAALARTWWRNEAALCHLTAWSKPWKRKKIRGSFKVIAPGARGGSKDGSEAAPAENPARDLDYELLLEGKLDFKRDNLQEQYFLGPWLLSGLKPGELQPLRKPGTGKPLEGPAGLEGPWTEDDVPLLPKPLRLRRAGNQHSAWFDELEALEPQLQAGVDDDGPWFKFWDDAEPPLVNGGPSPFPPPTRPPAPERKFGAKEA
jgi:hypothetical protein